MKFMKPITIKPRKGKTVYLSLGKLMKMLARVPDKRKARGKRYPLRYLLGVILLAKLSGEQKPSGITEWVKARREELAQFFQFERFIAPSLNTIRRTLGEIISANELHCRFRRAVQF